MKKTVERIFRAVDNKEKIYIFADYDADGVPAGVPWLSLSASTVLTPTFILRIARPRGTV